MKSKFLSLFIGLLLSVNLFASDLISEVQKLDIIKDLDLKNIVLADKGVKAELGSESIYFFQGGSSKWNAAFIRNNSSIDSGIKLPDAVFLVAFDDNTLSKSDLPKDVSSKISRYGSIDLNLKKGVRLFANINPSGSSNKAISGLAKTIGLGSSLSLAGEFDYDTLKYLVKKSNDTGDYKLTLSTSSFTPTLVSKVVKGKDLSLVYEKDGSDIDIKGDFEIDITLPQAMHGKKLSFSAEIEVINPGKSNQEVKFSNQEGKTLSFNKAFGQDYLNITDLGFNIDFTSSKVEVVLNGKFDSKKIEVDFEEEGGSLSSFKIELDDDLKLSELPGLKNIPGANKFKIEDVIISSDAIAGKTDFKGEVLDVVIFKGDSGHWSLALDIEKSLSLGEMVGHNRGVLKQIKLPEVTLIMSSAGYHGNISDLPAISHTIFKKSSGSLSIPKGISLDGHFDPSHMDSSLKKALNTIGIKSKVEIEGTLTGVFGGTPGVTISTILTQSTKNSFKFLKHSNSKEEFFISLAGSEIDMGIRTEVKLDGGKGSHDLIFDASFELDVSGSDVEVALKGSMTGDWKNAMGIKGMTIEDPMLEVGVTSAGGFDFLLTGTFMFGSEKVTIAADMVFEPEALYLPSALAFAGKINKIPFGTITSHGDKLSKGKHGKGLKSGGFHGLDAELRDVAFAIVTAGAHLPAKLSSEMNIEGAGYALKGKLYAHNKELGEASGYVSTKGIKFDGEIKPFHLGPLNLKDAEIDVQAGPSLTPSFKMKGDIVLFKGFEEKYDLELSPDKFKLYTDTKFGGLFEVELDAETTHGLAFSSSNDLDFDAVLKSSHHDVFKKLMQGAVKGFQNGDKVLKHDMKKVDEAQKKVNNLKKKISSAKAEDKRNRDKASKKVRSAKSKVDKIAKDIKHLEKSIHDKKSQIHHDKKKWHWGSAAKHGIELGVLYTRLGTEKAAKKAADKVLNAVNKSIKKFPKGATPKVIALQAALKTETAALTVAKGVLKASKAANDGFKAAAKALTNVSKYFKIYKMEVSGSIKGILGKGGHSPMIKIYCKIGNKNHHYTVKIPKGAKDLKKVLKNIANQAAKDLVKVFKKA
jgi:hypothetical protein